MNVEFWQTAVHVFLAAGIVFLILTIIYSVKFRLISILQSEWNSRKPQTDLPVSVTPMNNRTVKSADFPERQVQSADTIPCRRVPQAGNTIPAYRKQLDENLSDDEFVIEDDIMIIHADPSRISFRTERNGAIL